MHIDLRARWLAAQPDCTGDPGKTNLLGILAKGFVSSKNKCNLVPPFIGGVSWPLASLRGRYQPLRGDMVYLVDKPNWVKRTNGFRIQNGWRPRCWEVVLATEDGSAGYELYRQALRSPCIVHAGVWHAPPLSSSRPVKTGLSLLK